jgi:hypothetical protein
MLRRICLCGACASGLVTPAPGRLRDPPWGYYGPCARCSLTARHDRRDTQAQPGAEASPKRRCREPQQSAERRGGRRYWPVISGDPEMGPLARRTTGAAFRTSACRRSAPVEFSRSRKGKGHSLLISAFRERPPRCSSPQRCFLRSHAGAWRRANISKFSVYELPQAGVPRATAHRSEI